jgi:putative transferase (TIGR04331 family)
MKTVQLISTSNEDKIHNGKYVYLGNWCKEDGYIIRDKVVNSYHWDDRKKLEQDNKYINDIYEKILEDLSNFLNKFHNQKFSKNYWRTVTGYWLFVYLSVNFERWGNIESVLLKHKDINLYQSLDLENNPLPENTREFLNLVSDKKWNHLNYTNIIKFLIKKKNLNIKLNSKKYNYEPFYYNYSENYIHKFKILLRKIYLNFFNKKIKNNKIVFFKTYLGLKNEIKLNLKYNQLPTVFINKVFKKNINFNLRKTLNLNYAPQNLFEEFIVANIFKNLPTEFIENYNEIEKYIKKSNLPSDPSLIMSARSIATDNIFVRYIATQKERGCKFIYGQHGGAYGHIKFSWAEEHEIKISDYYLTWGWKLKDEPKVIPYFVIKNIDKFKFKNKKKIKKICFFIRSRQKYTGRMDSSTGSNQMAKYYENCIDFCERFNSENNKINLVSRFHEALFEWNHINIWKKFGINNIISTNEESLEKVYKNYELLIYSYIGTGFLESLALNKPFILISPTEEWPLRDEVVEDFKALEDAKIFFKNNNDAIMHIQKINENDINEWWERPEVDKVKKFFREKYAKLDNNNNKISTLKKLIDKIVTNEI